MCGEEFLEATTCQAAQTARARGYHRWVRRWYVWLPISVALFGLLVWRTRPWEAADLASQLDFGLLVAALGVNILVALLWAVRSYPLMAAVGSPLSLSALVPIDTFANTINNLTPASSGEVLRAYILKRRHGVPYHASTAVILAERFWAIGLMLVTAAAAALGTLVAVDSLVVVVGWLVAVGLAFVPSFAYLAGLRPGRLARWVADRTHLARAGWMADRLTEVDDRLADIVLRPRTAVAFLISTGAIFALFAAQLWLVLEAFGATLPLGGVWAALGLSICAGVISALPFGLGAADAVLVVLLVAQGVAPPAATAVAIVLRSVATLPLGIAGTLAWVYLGRGATQPVRLPE